MKNLFYIIAVIFISILITQKAFAVEYPDVNIYYENNHQIWLFNPKTKERKYIADGITPHMSHKKDKLLYAQYYSDNDPPNNGITFYIYFPATNKTEKLLVAKEGEFYDYNLGIEEWSPDDSYIVLDTGTDIERGKIIIDSKTGEKITDFAHIGEYSWLNENEIIFSNVQISDGINYGTKGAPPLGISILNVKTQERKIIIKTTKTENFMFAKLLDNNKILISKTTYKLNKQGYNTVDRYYSLTMDKNGNNIEEIRSSEKYINTAYPIQLPHLNNNLVVVEIENRSYIMDETTRNILIEIGGGNATW